MATVRDMIRKKGSEVYSISPESTVFEALDAMAKHNTGALLVMASVLFDQRQPRRAARLFTAADTLRDSIGAAWEPVEQTTLDRGLDRARVMLGDDECAALQFEARMSGAPYDGGGR